MVIYNPKDWFTLIFKFHKSDTFRKLFWVMVAVGIYTGLVVYVELEILKVVNSSTSLMYQLLGFVISMLLVFRTNTAYDRWWEGRKLWGALVNASRNLAIKVQTMVPEEAGNKHKFIGEIGDFANVLRWHLRGLKWDGLSIEVHQPNHLVASMYAKLNGWLKNKHIDGDQMRVIESELSELLDICGACERIKKTPIPYSYSIFIKKFIFAYVMTLPFGFVAEYGYGIIPIVIFTLYALASLELIAEEIENPFGTDANDLPMDTLVETIKQNLMEIEGSGEEIRG
ncbi:MAG TPA: hypothetical protein DIW47_14665 [Bacteroidetes bacterium]|nr:hypothetical protein [Bacteroidota bacterium]